MPSAFNDDLIERLNAIDLERTNGKLTYDRATEKVNAAFFELLTLHYPAPEEPREPPKPFRLVRPRRITHHSNVEEVLRPDRFLIRRSGRCFEFQLCSVRTSPDSPDADALANALSQALLMERVTIEHCCWVGHDVECGVITKVKPDPLLPHSVNHLLVNCGFAVLEPTCRNKCDYFVPKTVSVAGRTRNRFLRSVQDRGDRQLEYLLGNQCGTPQ